MDQAVVNPPKTIQVKAGDQTYHHDNSIDITWQYPSSFEEKHALEMDVLELLCYYRINGEGVVNVRAEDNRPYHQRRIILEPVRGVSIRISPDGCLKPEGRLLTASDEFVGFSLSGQHYIIYFKEPKPRT